MIFIIVQIVQSLSPYLNLFNNVIRLSPITPLVDIDFESYNTTYSLTISSRFSTQEELDALV